MVTHLNNEFDFLRLVHEIKGIDLIVVEFVSQYCVICRAIIPKLEKLAKEETLRVIKFYRVDIDEMPSVAEEYEIVDLPTFLFIRNGRIIKRFVGSKMETFQKEYLDVMAVINKERQVKETKSQLALCSNEIPNRQGKLFSNVEFLNRDRSRSTVMNESLLSTTSSRSDTNKSASGSKTRVDKENPK